MFSLLKSEIRYHIYLIGFFSIWVLFHEHWRFIGQQGKGKDVSLIGLYHFDTLCRYLDNSRVNTAGSLRLHIARSWTRVGNLWLTLAHILQSSKFNSLALKVTHFTLPKSLTYYKYCKIGIVSIRFRVQYDHYFPGFSYFGEFLQLQ